MRALVLVGLCLAAAFGQGGMVLDPQAPTDSKPELVVGVEPVEPIRAMTFSPDGSLLASRGEDGTVRLWDGATLQPLGEPLRGVSVTSLAFSPDGRTVALGVAEGGFWLWDRERRQTIAGLRHAEGVPVSAVLFSPDGRTVASVGLIDRVATARLWDVASRRSRGGPLVGHTANVECLAFSPDSRLLATGGWDAQVRLWEVATGRPVGRMPSLHFQAVATVAFSPDGRTLASHGYQDGKLILWDLAAGQPRLQCQPNSIGSEVSLAFSSDGATVTAACATGMCVWDALNGKPLASFTGQERPDPGHLMAVSPDGRMVAGVGQDNVVRLWSAATGRLRGAQTARLARLDGLAFSPDGKLLAAAGEDGVAIWEVDSGQVRGRGSPGRSRHTGVAWSPDGATLVCLGGGSLERIEVASGRRLPGSPHGHGGPVTAVAYAPDGRSLLGTGQDGGIYRWDAATGELRGSLKSSQSVLDSLAVSVDGKTLAVVKGDSAVADVTFTRTAPNSTTHESRRSGSLVAISPDNRTIACAGGESVLLVGDPETGRRQGKPLAPQPATAAAVRVWDLTTGQPVCSPLRGHTKAVQCLDFSPDGRLLATGGGDQTVRLWDVATGQPRGAALAAHSDRVMDLDFSPDGRLLASGGLDGSIGIWQVAAGRLLATFYGLDGGDRFLSVTPGGYYHGSLDIGPLVRWRIGPATYPFDQFADRYHRPDLVRRALAGEELSEAPLSAVQLPPTVTFTAPAYGAEVAGREVEVALTAEGKQAIARVELTVNGRPLPAELARCLVVDEGETQAPIAEVRRFRVKVPLPAGAYRARLRAVCYDVEQLCSRPAELLLVAPRAEQQPATLHVLAIGLNRYANLPEEYQLRYAVPDAERLAAALAQQGGGKPYTAVHPVVLSDARATLSNIKLALRDLKDSATEADVAVVFISGHGISTEDQQFYFPTHAVELDNLPDTALSWQDFVDTLREVRARQVLVLADTCHSGGIVGARPLDSDQLAGRLNRIAHQMVFTAAAREEVSLGREAWGHGAFTFALLEALGGKADTGRDGQISFAELRDYVTARVPALTEGQQHPQLPFLDRFEPDAVLARVVAPAR